MEKPGFGEEVCEPNLGYQSPKACPKQSGTVEWPNPCISYWSILCFFMIECAIYCFKTARYTVRSFSIRRNEKIACYVTVRDDKAMRLLESELKIKE